MARICVGVGEAQKWRRGSSDHLQPTHDPFGHVGFFELKHLRKRCYCRMQCRLLPKLGQQDVHLRWRCVGVQGPTLVTATYTHKHDHHSHDSHPCIRNVVLDSCDDCAMGNLQTAFAHVRERHLVRPNGQRPKCDRLQCQSDDIRVNACLYDVASYALASGVDSGIIHNICAGSIHRGFAGSHLSGQHQLAAWLVGRDLQSRV